MSDQAGNGVGEAIRYYPYGATRAGNPGTLPTDYLYTGQRRQEPLGGLYHMGARFYDPALGRWLSADSIIPDEADPQALNRYAYALNNPILYRDPSGHIVVTSIGAFLAYKGARAAIGATVTGGTYLLNAKRTGSFEWSQLLLTAGVGAATSTWMGKAAIATKGAKLTIGQKMARSAFISAEGHLLGKTIDRLWWEPEPIDSKDFVIETVFGGGTEGIIGKTGAGKWGSRAISAASTSAESIAKDVAHGEPIGWKEALLAFPIQGVKDIIGQDLFKGWAAPKVASYWEKFINWWNTRQEAD
jgi:RHS repeat-associated protein